MKKRTISILLISAIMLSACGGGKNKEEVKKEKIDVTLFEENDKKQSKYKGYTVEEVYINGKKEKIDVQSHGEHYHIIFKGKKYSLSKEKYNELFKVNNKIVLSEETLEKEISQLKEEDIISYYKHGDHWHVKTKYGEFITREDPSKLRNIANLKENSIRTISKSELNSVKIVSYYKHGDHWHIKTSDGREYISYSDPSGKRTINEVKKADVIEKIEDIIIGNSNGKKIKSYYKHGDHWHVTLEDGTEYITYKDPALNMDVDKNAIGEKIDVIDKIEDNKINGKKIKSYYKHGDHWHVILEDGTEYITYKDPSGKTDISDIKDIYKPNTEKDKGPFEKVVDHGDHIHVWYKGKEYVIDRKTYEESIKTNKFNPDKNVDDNKKFDFGNGPFEKVVEHGDHVHVWINGKESVLSKDEYEKQLKEAYDKLVEETKKVTDIKYLNYDEMKSRAEKMVSETMSKYGITRDKIKVDIFKNVVVYPHGSHYHYDKIDPNRPIVNDNHGHDHNHDLEEPDRNPEVEKLDIIGPFILDFEEANNIGEKNKSSIMKKLGITDVVNPDNYNKLAFFSVRSKDESGDGKLNIEGKDAKVVVYFVKYGVSEKVLENITVPTPIANENYVFKSWSGALLKESIKRDVHLYAEFRNIKFEKSPAVFGPYFTPTKLENDNIDARDYSLVQFTTSLLGNPNAKLNVNGKLSNHVYYYIKNELTWKEYKDSGLIVPEVVVDEGYEFLGWSVDPNLYRDDEKNIETYFYVKTATTAKVIGKYVPTDENNPLDSSDINRPHPRGNIKYDPEKYMTIALRVDDKGNFYEFIGNKRQKTKVISLVVRRGSKWNEIAESFTLPTASKGNYEISQDFIDLINSDLEVTEGIYNINFVEKNVKPIEDDYSDFYGKKDNESEMNLDEKIKSENESTSTENLLDIEKKTDEPKDEKDNGEHEKITKTQNEEKVENSDVDSKIEKIKTEE